MITINDSQKVKLALKPVTASGRPALVSGIPLWSVDSSSVSLEVAPDGLSAYAFSVAPGNARVSAIANADLSGGTREISAFIDISVVPTEAISMTIEAETPEEI